MDTQGNSAPLAGLRLVLGISLTGAFHSEPSLQVCMKRMEDSTLRR